MQVWRSACTAPVGGSQVPDEVAVKVFVSAGAKTSRLTDDQLTTVAKTEFAACQKFKHANVTATYGLVVEAGLVANVLELNTEGDLFGAIKPGYGMSAQDSSAVLAGVCAGLHYLHTEHQLVHLDLKSENIFLSPGPVPKLGDFDACLPIGTAVGRVRGTESIHPPEFLKGNQPHYTIASSADVWAVGMLAYTVLFGSYAWMSAGHGRDPKYTAYVETKAILPAHAPEQLKALFDGILAAEPTARPTAQEIQDIVESSWVPLCTALRSSSSSQTSQSNKSSSSSSSAKTKSKKSNFIMRALRAITGE